MIVINIIAKKLVLASVILTTPILMSIGTCTVIAMAEQEDTQKLDTTNSTGLFEATPESPKSNLTDIIKKIDEILEQQKQEQLERQKQEQLERQKQEQLERQQQEQSKQKNLSQQANYTENDLELLSRLVYSEAGTEPFEGKVAVANVVLYRCKIKNKSISEVIYQQGQFDGVKTKNFNQTPNKESIEASRQALNGSIVVSDAYFFADLRNCSPEWANEGLFITRIGNHWFYRQEK